MSREKKNGGYSYGDYKPAESVTQAQTALEQQQAAKPGAYQSQWDQQLKDTMDKILNRKDFSYDLNGDALYQQYRQQAIRDGRLAMMDTVGQASALTGGYGNSYAQTVGQQAYQQSLSQLNDRIPQLYQLALQRYDMENQGLKEQYALLADRENADYGRYRDRLGDWRYDTDYLTGRYDTERGIDLDRFYNDRDYAFQVWKDKQDRAWQKKVYEDQMAAAGFKSGSGGGGGYVPDPSPDVSNYDLIRKAANTLQSSGEAQSAVAYGVEAAYKNGDITRTQANAIISDLKFVDPKKRL